MKDLNLTEIFCEISSGLLLIGIFLPWTCEGNMNSISEIYRSCFANVTSSTIIVLLVFSYLLGLVVDALGLVADAWLFRHIFQNSPTSAERRDFFSSAPAHILQYRDNQWAYYSLYRNIFLINVAGFVSIITFTRETWSFAEKLALFAIVAFLNLCFFRAMTSIVNLYFEITKSGTQRHRPFRQ